MNSFRWILRSMVASIVILGMSAIAVSGSADTIYNTIDNTIDTTHELVNLTFPGTPGSTTLKIQVDGHPDHPNCNIQGAAHHLGVTASSSPAGIVDVAFAAVRSSTSAPTRSPSPSLLWRSERRR